MAKKNGSTPGNKETMEGLEHFYSLPIEEQTAILVERGSDPQLIAKNILRNEEQLRRAYRLDRIGKPTRSNKTDHPPELTRLHRLTNEEADLIQGFRLLSAQAKLAVSALLQMQSESYIEPTVGNVVSIVRD